MKYRVEAVTEYPGDVRVATCGVPIDMMTTPHNFEGLTLLIVPSDIKPGHTIEVTVDRVHPSDPE